VYGYTHQNPWRHSRSPRLSRSAKPWLTSFVRAQSSKPSFAGSLLSGGNIMRHAYYAVNKKNTTECYKILLYDGTRIRLPSLSHIEHIAHLANHLQTAESDGRCCPNIVVNARHPNNEPVPRVRLAEHWLQSEAVNMNEERRWQGHILVLPPLPFDHVLPYSHSTS
jgi:hypothetical protein